MDKSYGISHWPCWIERLRESESAVSVESRIFLVESISVELQRGDLPEDDSTLREITQILAHDSEWQVRLAISRIAYLLHDELLVALCKDSNTYVRSNAQNSLSRRSKFNRQKLKTNQVTKSYLQQLDRLTEKHGAGIATKIHELAQIQSSLMISSVAHGFKSILTTLTANVEKLNGELQNKQRIISLREDIDLINHIVSNMELFVKDLAVEKNYEPLDDLVDSALEKAKMKIAKLGYDTNAIQVNVNLPEGIRINVTRQLVILALTNLIKNAYEIFASNGNHLSTGVIDIKAEVHGYEIDIFINDNGPGIEQASLTSIRTFSPGNINKAKRESTGFGLPIAHRYITSNCGSIKIESKPDLGTTVIITLPLRNNEDCE